VGIAFLLGFARVCNTLPNSKIYVMEPKGFMGYPKRCNACELSTSEHEQYPFKVQTKIIKPILFVDYPK
jgi:hypothetical protein